MIESKNDTSKNLERALQALKQAQQRVANEKKKQNEKKRKAENHHKYIMGGIIVKYFPDCYRYDEGELKHILSVALQTKECQQIIAKIKSESREATPPQSTLPNAENESRVSTKRKCLSGTLTRKKCMTGILLISVRYCMTPSMQETLP